MSFMMIFNLIATIGKWLIEKDLMGIEQQKHFLAWVSQASDDGAISAKLRLKYDSLLRKHGYVRDDVPGAGERGRNADT